MSTNHLLKRLAALHVKLVDYRRKLVYTQHQVFETEEAIKLVEEELAKLANEKTKQKQAEKNKAEAKQAQAEMLKQIAGGNDGGA